MVEAIVKNSSKKWKGSQCTITVTIPKTPKLHSSLGYIHGTFMKNKENVDKGNRGLGQEINVCKTGITCTGCRRDDRDVRRRERVEGGRGEGRFEGTGRRTGKRKEKQGGRCEREKRRTRGSGPSARPREGLAGCYARVGNGRSWCSRASSPQASPAFSSPPPAAGLALCPLPMLLLRSPLAPLCLSTGNGAPLPGASHARRPSLLSFCPRTPPAGLCVCTTLVHLG